MPRYTGLQKLVRVSSCCGFAVIFFCVSPLSAEPLKDGQKLYESYCASCHGIEGRGDGYDARDLITKPADLTKLEKKAGGNFPQDKVIRAIDGRAMPEAHGSSQMPVWGEWFASQAMADGVLQDDKAGIEMTIKKRLLALAVYLKSLQD